MKHRKMFGWKKYSIILSGILAFLLFITGISIVTFSYMKLTRESTLQELKKQIYAGSDQLQFYFSSIRSDLLRLKRYLANNNMLIDDKLYQQMKFVEYARPEAIPGILILDADGNVLATTTRALNQINFQQSEYLKTIRAAHGIFFSRAITPSDSDKHSAFVSEVFQNALDMAFVMYSGIYSKGEFKGGVFFILNAQPFFSRYSRAITSLASGSGFMLQEDGRIMYHREIELRGKFLSELPENFPLAKVQSIMNDLKKEILWPPGLEQQIMVAFPLNLENRRWILGISTATSKSTQKTLTFIFTLSGLAAFLGFIIFGLIFALNRLDLAQKALIAEKEQLNVILQSKMRLDLTLHSIADGIITTNKQGEIILMNKIAEELTRWSQKDAAGKHIEEVFHLAAEKIEVRHENSVEKIVKTGTSFDFPKNMLLISRAGSKMFIAGNAAPIRDHTGSIIGVVTVFRDITQQRKSEEELLKAGKLESVGILAGGIAHDFNNILTVVIGNVSLAKLYKGSEEKLIKRLTATEEALVQAKALTNQLLTFSTGGAPIKKTMFISSLIKDSVKFALRGSNVKCLFSLSDNLWSVKIDQGQINQVFNNLIINADQAMIEGGTIWVRAENTTIGKLEKDLYPSLSKGNYVKISIKDQGVGIPQEHFSKIFDPYFTTKQTGTGLGLAISYSIVKNHKGHLIVESKLGRGTSFHIYLPASMEKVSPKRFTPGKEMGKSLLLGQGKILVMDDERMLRDVAGAMLTKLGYKVEFAKDGEEAVKAYAWAKEQNQPFSAVIMDLTIPGGMGGEETIKKIIEIDPNVRAIVSSGYSTDPIMADFRRYGFCGCINKPYSIQELGKTLHDVINN